MSLAASSGTLYRMRTRLATTTVALAALALAGCAAGARPVSLSRGLDPTATAPTPSRTATSPPESARSGTAGSGATAPTTAAATTGATAAPTARPRPVVVIDPGHNGANYRNLSIIDRLVPAGFGRTKPCNTTGTQTAAGYPEHAFTFDVAERVGSLLRQQGVIVALTRTDDDGVGPCVNERAAFGNARHADAVVSIHADGHVGGSGFHVIEASHPPAGAATAAASHRLAVSVHDAYLAGSGFAPSTYLGVDGYDRRDDLAGLNLSTRPTIFIECGNMANAGDAAKLTSASGRERIAQAIATGIEGFLNPG